MFETEKTFGDFLNAVRTINEEGGSSWIAAWLIEETDRGNRDEWLERKRAFALTPTLVREFAQTLVRIMACDMTMIESGALYEHQLAEHRSFLEQLNRVADGFGIDVRDITSRPQTPTEALAGVAR